MTTCYAFTPPNQLHRPQCQCGQVRRESHVQRLGESQERVVGCSACCKVCRSGERVIVGIFGEQKELSFETLA